MPIHPLALLAALVLFLMAGFNTPRAAWGWFGLAILTLAVLLPALLALR